jgi:SAM-dependent methyltransferase
VKEIMDDNQQITIDSYNSSIPGYVAYTVSKPSGEFVAWMDQFAEMLPTRVRVLEIGSGPGRDADYLESQGIDIIRTDAAQGFIDYQRDTMGKEVIRFDPLKGTYPHTYGAIFAAGVFLHFTPDQLKLALANLQAGLAPNALIAFSLKQGDGEDFKEHKIGPPRYFKYWQRRELDSLLTGAGVKICSVQTGLNGKWLLYIGRKSD